MEVVDESHAFDQVPLRVETLSSIPLDLALVVALATRCITSFSLRYPVSYSSYPDYIYPPWNEE